MARLRLKPDPASPRQARDFVRDLLSERGIDSSVIDDAALLTTEVVTNAVIHARTSISVDVELGREITISVTDSSRKAPRLRNPSPADTTGRGVLLLDRLSSHWEVIPVGDGKTVRFRLPATQMALEP